ncbi:MAG TPA: hypothetical protein VE912_09410 [Bacteroidales bacterium]|nr:hypothetical protein [Bacteroidales bacterium]
MSNRVQTPGNANSYLIEVVYFLSGLACFFVSDMIISSILAPQDGNISLKSPET